jgi:non-ribosomal peptide synthetase component F
MHPRHGPVVAAAEPFPSALLFDTGLMQRLRAVADRASATLYMVLLAGFLILLHRYTGEQDIAVAALLGILKAGGAYLPLDPAYPLERLRYMLDDARPPVLLPPRLPWPRACPSSPRSCSLTRTAHSTPQALPTRRPAPYPMERAMCCIRPGQPARPRAWWARIAAR